MMKIAIPRWQVLYAESYNIKFFHNKEQAKQFAHSKELSKMRDGEEYR